MELMTTLHVSGHPCLRATLDNLRPKRVEFSYTYGRLTLQEEGLGRGDEVGISSMG